MEREIQMDGIEYSVEWTHVGQYRPYGDFFRVAEVHTDSKDLQDILDLMRVFYSYDVPLKKDWDTSTFYSYFRGYCEVTPILGGWKYSKCEPYTD